MRKLKSNDIIELFSHSTKVGQNSQGVYIVPCTHDSHESLLFVSENGIGPIKQAIGDAIDGQGDPTPAPGRLDLCELIREDHQAYYFDFKSQMDGLGFAILVPNRYRIDIAKPTLIKVFSRILQSLSYSRGGWA